MFSWTILNGLPQWLRQERNCLKCERPEFDPGKGRSPGKGTSNPLQYSCQEKPMDRGVWQATIHRVTKNWTWFSDWTAATGRASRRHQLEKGYQGLFGSIWRHILFVIVSEGRVLRHSVGRRQECYTHWISWDSLAQWRNEVSHPSVNWVILDKVGHVQRVSMGWNSCRLTETVISSGSVVKNPRAKQEMQVQSLHQEDPLEKEMATLSNILDWRIRWTEEPSGLQFMELRRVRHDWANEPTIPWYHQIFSQYFNFPVGFPKNVVLFIYFSLICLNEAPHKVHTLHLCDFFLILIYVSYRYHPSHFPLQFTFWRNQEVSFWVSLLLFLLLITFLWCHLICPLTLSWK